MSSLAESATEVVGAEKNSANHHAIAPAVEQDLDDATGKVLAGNPAKTEAAETSTVLYSEDLSVGDIWTTPFRQITVDDVHEFATLTGDHTSLHGDSGSENPYGKPIAHGLLGLSVLAGLGATCPNASTLAFVGIEDWQFLAPVYFGDSVQARNKIVSIEKHGRRAVKVRWLRQLLNETGRVVQEGHFVTLVGSKARNTKKPR